MCLFSSALTCRIGLAGWPIIKTPAGSFIPAGKNSPAPTIDPSSDHGPVEDDGPDSPERTLSDRGPVQASLVTDQGAFLHGDIVSFRGLQQTQIENRTAFPNGKRLLIRPEYRARPDRSLRFYGDPTDQSCGDRRKHRYQSKGCNLKMKK